MPVNEKMSNQMGIRLYEAIKHHIYENAANAFADKLPLSKSADHIRKFKWAKDVCQYLEENFTPDEVRDIRMNCSCKQSDTQLQDAKQIYDSSASLDEFCENYNRKLAGVHNVWHEGEDIFFSYPQCYCSAVKRINENLPATWCLCTLGYTKRMFEFILDGKTEVELIESVKLGNSRCVMRIRKA